MDDNGHSDDVDRAAARPTDDELRDMLHAAAVLTAFSELIVDSRLGAESRTYADRVDGYVDSIRGFVSRQPPPEGGWLSDDAARFPETLQGWRLADLRQR